MRILIIRFSSFGDIILTTPVINELINKYPDAEIDYLVYKNFSDAITFNPKIKRYYYLFGKKQMMKMAILLVMFLLEKQILEKQKVQNQ